MMEYIDFGRMGIMVYLLNSTQLEMEGITVLVSYLYAG